VHTSLEVHLAQVEGQAKFTIENLRSKKEEEKKRKSYLDKMLQNHKIHQDN